METATGRSRRGSQRATAVHGTAGGNTYGNTQDVTEDGTEDKAKAAVPGGRQDSGGACRFRAGADHG